MLASLRCQLINVAFELLSHLPRTIHRPVVAAAACLLHCWPQSRYWSLPNVIKCLLVRGVNYLIKNVIRIVIKLGKIHSPAMLLLAYCIAGLNLDICKFCFLSKLKLLLRCRKVHWLHFSRRLGESSLTFKANSQRRNWFDATLRRRRRRFWQRRRRRNSMHLQRRRRRLSGMLKLLLSMSSLEMRCRRIGTNIVNHFWCNIQKRWHILYALSITLNELANLI